MSVTVPDNRVGIMQGMPFNAALWRYVSQQTSMNESRCNNACKPSMDKDMPRRRIDRGPVGPLPEAPVANSCLLRKEILMLSLSPSIYGNKYGVLGSS